MVNWQAWWNGLGTTLAVVGLGLGVTWAIQAVAKRFKFNANGGVVLWLVGYGLIVIGLVSGGLAVKWH